MTYLQTRFPDDAAAQPQPGGKGPALSRFKGGNYDVSSNCNLTCEGCLFFARADGVPLDRDGGDDWDALFAGEAARGVNFAYIAGAEPSLVPGRLAAAWRHIKAGVIFTNGTRRIDPAIGFRIHVSLWGLDELAATLRGGDSVAKALRNYASDPRAVFAFTISRENLHQVQEVTRRVAEAGGKLTFSYFSPTEIYQTQAGRVTGNDYMRLDESIRLSAADLSRARTEIEAAMAAHPETVIYSLDYDDWVRQPGERLYDLDENGIARDCGNRLSPEHRHYTHDGKPSGGKCCLPNLDCRDCRAYAPALGTFVTRSTTDPEARRARLRALRIWYRLFMPLDA